MYEYGAAKQGERSLRRSIWRGLVQQRRIIQTLKEVETLHFNITPKNYKIQIQCFESASDIDILLDLSWNNKKTGHETASFGLFKNGVQSVKIAVIPEQFVQNFKASWIKD